ncbi:MBL fold metallo-hydrolase [Aeromonas salmonicida]|uniref:MBL fold metallo-hydrolase n=1 Tax=Aeromonas salmonicida TaxID=645 RepID=UPI0038B6CFDD
MAALAERLGEVYGVVFSHPQEKTLYLAGDTVWNEMVAQSLRQHEPNVIILNCGDAQVPGLGSIIMGKEDVRAVYQAAPQATLIASHMEAVNHAVLSRKELRDYLAEHGMADRVRATRSRCDGWGRASAWPFGFQLPAHIMVVHRAKRRPASCPYR